MGKINKAKDLVKKMPHPSSIKVNIPIGKAQAAIGASMLRGLNIAEIGIPNEVMRRSSKVSENPRLQAGKKRKTVT